MGKCKVFILFTILFTLICINISPAEETAKILLLYTNDIHGHIMPYEDSTIAPAPEKIGGFQYLSTLIKNERSKNPEGTLLLDGGDIAQGNLYSNMAYGIPVIELMNVIGYDGGVLGNHDFDWGEQKLVNMISAAKFPLLACNLIKMEDGSFIDGTIPYIIKNINGIRIGIIGIACTDTSVLSAEINHGKFYFLSGEETLKYYIPVLKEIHKVNLIIVISHLGYEKDIELADNISGIDIIVGSHSHKVIDTPVVKNNTIILQAGKYLSCLGKLELEVDKNTKKIVSHKGELVKILDSKIEADREVEKLLDKYREKYENLGNKIIGETSVELTKNNKEECNLGNLIADIIKISAKSDIALINTGGLREDIPKGKITMEKLYGVFPFENMIISMDLKGKYIKDIVETCFTGNHAILQVSGLKIKYDSSKPDKEQVIEILVNNKPIQEEKNYRIATVDFLAAGGDGYDEFKKGENLQNVMFARDAIIKYFKEYSPVTDPIEGSLENIESQ